jgi:hypothetical protein
LKGDCCVRTCEEDPENDIKSCFQDREGRLSKIPYHSKNQHIKGLDRQTKQHGKWVNQGGLLGRPQNNQQREMMKRAKAAGKA